MGALDDYGITEHTPYSSPHRAPVNIPRHSYPDSGTHSVALSFTHSDIFSLGSVEIRVLAGFTNGLSVVCDVLIAAGLCYYLNSGKSGFAKYVPIVAVTRI